MRSRDTLLGLVVVGLIVAGVWWARARSPAPTAGSPPPAGAGQAAQPGPEAAIPDVTVTDGEVDVGDIRLTLSVSPRPPVAFTKMRFRVSASATAATDKTPAERQLTLEGGRVSFEMVMPMGDHRYALVPGDDGWQEAEVVLPMCRSGNPRWYAIVEGTVGGRDITGRFRLDLVKPSSTPAAIP